MKKANRADASGTQCVILEKVRYPTDVRGWKKEDFVNGRQRTQKAESHAGRTAEQDRRRNRRA